MSIPVDFLGLNTLIAKNVSNDKNMVFNSDKPKVITIDSPVNKVHDGDTDNKISNPLEDNGISINLIEDLGYDSYSDLRSNHHGSHHSSIGNPYEPPEGRRGFMKNFSISMWYDLSNFDGISTSINTTWSAGNVGGGLSVWPLTAGGSFLQSNVSSSVCTLFSSCLDNNHRNISVALQRNQNNKLSLTLLENVREESNHALTPTSRVYAWGDKEIPLNSSKVNLIIACSDYEDKYIHKSNKADVSQTHEEFINFYLNGQKVNFVEDTVDVFADLEQANSIKDLIFFKDYSDGIQYSQIELSNNFILGGLFHYNVTNAFNAQTTTTHADVNFDTGLRNYFVYRNHLNDKQAVELYSLGPYFNFKNLDNVSRDLSKYQFVYNNTKENQNLNIKDNDFGNLNESIASFTGSNGEQSIFSALMNNINGPYGYSSFKQLRASQNWVMRSHNKNNIFSFVPENGKIINVISNNQIISTQKTKFGDIQNLYESSITDKHSPLELIGTISDDGFDEEKILIKSSYSNQIQYFKNNSLNVETNKQVYQSDNYENFKNLMALEETPLDSFDKLTFKQTVFPKNLYTHSRNHRIRPSYSSKIWRDVRASRTELDENNGFGFSAPSQSFWPLDAEEWFNEIDVPFWGSSGKPFPGGSLHNNSVGGNGVLQNFYNMFTTSSFTTYIAGIDNYVTASCVYNRLHTLSDYDEFTGSTLNPAIRDKFTQNNLTAFGRPKKFQGTAVWDTGRVAESIDFTGKFIRKEKQPFPNSYEEWSESFRGLGKNYSVVPEFRISDHVTHYLTNGFTAQKLDFLEVKGGNESYANSSDTDFFNIYTTTDFLKNFEIVKKDFENKASPTRITLRCKAIKKFLPYEGFYPCQRSVHISEQFNESYAPFVEGSSSNTGLSNLYVSGSKYIVQNIITPLFAPGVLFNTIKSGIACDYPIMTKIYTTSSDGRTDASGTPFNCFIDDIHTERVPFEALLEPEKYLANKNIYSNEPEHRTPKVVTKWSGIGDNRYKLMINNFLSEVPDFFLQNEEFTTITSLPQGDPNFGNTEKGKVYGMRIKMFRTIDGQTSTEEPTNGIVYQVPQDNIGNMDESFTMYSRPSAFGPPYRTTVTTGSPLSLKNWSKFKFDGSVDFSYDLSNTINSDITGSNPAIGENYIHTPPYYHGEAWADIFFQPPSGSQKYTLAEIINNSSVEFCRHYLSSSDSAKNIEDRSLLINEQAMQIASSMNIFSRGILREDTESLTINTQLETKYRWIIQSKFETPTLNFNHYSLNPYVTAGSVLFDEPLQFRHGANSELNNINVPIGMWHQYGRLPQRTDEGIFIQVTDIPPSWIEGAMLGNTNNTGSLVDLCGFSTDPVRVGEIKNTKTIQEAVVAIPFVNREGFRKFFKLNKNDVENSIKGIEEAVGPTVFKLTQQLDKYVFPPQFDYKRNPDIQPVAMYVFEFSHEFTKQDLADIWQNLPPKLGEVHETAEATISHALFAEEFLGTGSDPQPTANGIERNVVSGLTDLPSDIQWMVFKVKKRAKSNYFEKMFQRNESRESDSNTSFTVDSTGKKSDVSYNWPYDFFSMVELIKLDAEVEFSNVDEDKSKQEKKLVTKPYIFRED